MIDDLRLVHEAFDLLAELRESGSDDDSGRDPDWLLDGIELRLVALANAMTAAP